MNDHFGWILLTGLTLLLSGCETRMPEPVLQLRRVIPGGNHVMLEVTAVTRVHIQPPPWISTEVEMVEWKDPTVYLFDYPLDQPGINEKKPIKPNRVQAVRQSSAAPSSNWGEPFVRVMRGQMLGPDRFEDDRAEVLRPRPDGSGWDVLKRWSSPHTRSTFVPSSDGRYLVIRWPTFTIFDAATLQTVPDKDGSIQRMFDRAADFAGNHPAAFLLTHRLDYLAVGALPNGMIDPDLLPASAAESRRYRGPSHILVFARGSGKVVATADTDYSRNQLVGISETATGELRLLYTDSLQPEPMHSATLRDANSHDIAHDSVGSLSDESSGIAPVAVSDPAHHCVWFHPEWTYYPRFHDGTLTVRRWDYDSGRVETHVLDIAGNFRVGGRNFVLSNRFHRQQNGPGNR